MKVRAPRTPVERELERLQIDVTRGELARPARDALIFGLWRQGVPQVEIARRLTRASLRAGGEAVSRNSVQKACSRMTNGDDHD